MINQLTNIIRDPENHADQRTAVRQAIDRLGDLREVEAIDVLVDYISFPWVSYHGHRQRFLGKGRLTAPRPDGTPAVDALVAIGEPCIPKVISKLAETESVFEQNSCIAVLRRIDAQESVLEQLTEALKNATERQRPSLERALQEVVVHEDVR